MKTVSAEFVTSVATGGDVPSGALPVIALVGRSNVGKSSLINALVKSRIARSGAKPGTTRLLNVYRVVTGGSGGRNAFIIVDLPGYGYARGGSEARREFDELTRGFFRQVDTGRGAPNSRGPRLVGLLLVVDIRHPGLAADVSAHAWAVDRQYPVVVVATKADRISRAARDRGARAHVQALNPSRPLLTVSTRTGDGIGKVWAQLSGLL